MNERIKELAKQACFTEQNILDMSPGFEKFAELIVRECAKIADAGYGMSGYELLEHFGVK